MRYIDELGMRDRTVLLRVDLNVPLDDQRRITDDWRIQAVLPTIQYVMEAGGRLVIASHLGRPGGRVVPELSLAPVAERLSQLLEEKVAFAGDIVGGRAREAIERMPPGSAVMLENLRFDPGEEANSEAFARELADLADAYVDDAFANAHRAHASNVGVVRFLPDHAGGLLMKRELNALGRTLDSPDRPLVVVLGGSKVKSKIGVLENLARKADAILIGGAMAFPFLEAAGAGTFRADQGSVRKASDILREVEKRGGRMLLPRDLAVTGDADRSSSREVVPVEGIGPEMAALDIGPRTIERFTAEIEGAGTVIWNGPMGVFEKEPFHLGTRAVGEAIARCPGFSLAGGGDTALALRRYGLADRVSYISTGGGAFLAVLAGTELPAVKALNGLSGGEAGRPILVRSPR